MGATNIGASVHGRMARPASSGEYRRANCRNCTSRKMAPNIPKLISMALRLARLKARLWKKRGGSMGAGARRSHSRKAASSATPSASAPRTRGLVQPSPLPLMSAHTTPKSPAEARPTPGRSRRPAGPWLSRRPNQASGMRAMPMGTLTQKIQFHATPSTMAPPTSGPMAMARPPTAPQAPSATPRRSAGTAALSSVNVRGVTMAAPIPCAMRPTSSISTLLEDAAKAEAAAKMATPRMNMRRRPKRSPSAAPVSRNTANVSV